MSSSSTIPTTALTDPQYYPYRPISSLVPGPIRAKFTGTVVNIFGYGIESNAPKAAKGCLKLLLRDNSGEILVKLWYTEADYQATILLGSRVSVSTTHVSTTASPGMDACALRALPACVMTSIFPERDAGCTVHIHEVSNDGHEDALEGVLSTNLNGLMDLEAFVNGAAVDKFYEDVKLLVCVVGVGDLMTIPTRKGSSFQVIPIQILDASTTTTYTQINQVSTPTPTLVSLPVELSLSSSFATSLRTFISYQTVLLLTSAKLHSQDRRKIKLTPRSQILVNPAHIETIRLRRWINNLYPACNISASELTHLVSQIEKEKGSSTRASRLHRSSIATFIPGQGLIFQQRKSSYRKQYTWSLFTNQIILQQNVPFTAYISVIITDLKLATLWRRAELFCMPCPYHLGEHIYSNSPIGRCENSISSTAMTTGMDLNAKNTYKDSRTVTLRFNPLLLSGASDETGGFLVSLPPPSRTSFSHTANLPSNHPTTSRQVQHHQDQHHNIYLSDPAMKSLTGLSSDDEIFSPRTSINTDEEQHEEAITEYLQSIESLLLYRRVTLVVGWSSDKDDIGNNTSSNNNKHSQEQIQDTDIIRDGSLGDVGGKEGRREEGEENTNAKVGMEGGRIVILDVLT